MIIQLQTSPGKMINILDLTFSVSNKEFA